MEIEPTQQTVRSADGTQIGFQALGEGSPVILVHGAWNTSEHWMGVAELLAPQHRCLVMDRRARGLSGDGADYALAREIEDIEAVIDEAGDEVTLLGHSSGAIYALEVARRASLAHLVLYEPPLHFFGPGVHESRELVDRIRASVESDRPEEAATIFFEEEARLPDDQLSLLQSTTQWPKMAALAPTCVREWDAIFELSPTVDRYRELTVPTLLLGGTETKDHPSHATAALQETLPDVRVARLDGQGHTANVTAPHQVASNVISFLQQAA